MIKLLIIILALKQSTAGLSHSPTADKLTTTLFNIRSISAHFAPKIDALTSSTDSAPVTPAQVVLPWKRYVYMYNHNGIIAVKGL